jgi:hypothetical protein
MQRKNFIFKLEGGTKKGCLFAAMTWKEKNALWHCID